MNRYSIIDIGNIIFNSPSYISKLAVTKAPFFGKVLIKNKGIAVDRNDPNSRTKTLNKINERANLYGTNSTEPELMLFPEGTISNGN